MNWGNKIAFAYTGFVVFMLGMVYLAVNQDFDLIHEDYYDREIAYQDEIDALKRGMDFRERLETKLDEEGLRVAFSGLGYDSLELRLVRPSDKSMDRTYQALPGASFIDVPHDQLREGFYLVEIRWAWNGQLFLIKRELFV